jgi:predicted O-methyltransferase YrrM
MIIIKRFLWYLVRIKDFVQSFLLLTVRLLFRTREFRDFLVDLVGIINDHYSQHFGNLKDFEKTSLYNQITRDFIFIKSNVFNCDSKVTRPFETQIFSALVKALNPRQVMEIGTYNGFTTLHLLMNTSPDTVVYTLDLPNDYVATSPGTMKNYDDLQVAQLSRESLHNRIYKNYPEADKRIVELFGDSSQFDFKSFEGKIDLVFIDGNHSLPFVESDTRNALKMLSPQGMIIWHDYDFIVHKDVFTYLNRLAKTMPIYRVPRTRFAIYSPSIK